MIAVSDIMIEKVRQSLSQAALYPEGLIPLADMSGHYCSLQEIARHSSYKQLFAVDVDGRQVFVYFKL